MVELSLNGTGMATILRVCTYCEVRSQCTALAWILDTTEIQTFPQDVDEDIVGLKQFSYAQKSIKKNKANDRVLTDSRLASDDNCRQTIYLAHHIHIFNPFIDSKVFSTNEKSHPISVNDWGQHHREDILLAGNPSPASIIYL
jgi:hypothetical protein